MESPIFYALYGSQNGLSALLQPPTRFAAMKTDSSNFYKPNVRFAVVKTDIYYTFCGGQNARTELQQPTHALRWSKRILLASTANTRFAQDSPRIWKPPARFCGAQNGRSELLHAIRWSKRTLQTSTRLIFVLRLVVKTDSSNIYKPPTRFAVSKTHSRNFNKRPTRFAVVKTGFPYFYTTPTRFAVVETDCLGFYKAIIRFTQDSPSFRKLPTLSQGH